MKRFCTLIFILTFYVTAIIAQNETPWKNGKLQVSDNNRYLVHENGKPFFWLGDTGWLMPERLNRDEVNFYLNRCAKAGYNVIQVQTVNGVPAYNAYGQSSHPFGYDFTGINNLGTYGYWDHMDHIIRTAEQNGIYIGMVCIWGGLVKSGKMNEEEAVAMMESSGWLCEGICWGSPAEGDPVYRMYDPALTTGGVIYTASEEEKLALIGRGWVCEDVCWHCVPAA